MEPYILEVQDFLKKGKQNINSACSGLEPWEIIAYSVGITVALIQLWRLMKRASGMRNSKQQFLYWLRSLPIIRDIVEEKMNSISQEIEGELRKGLEGIKFIHSLPQSGWPVEKIIERIQEYHTLRKVEWIKGNVSGAVYYGRDECLENLVTKIYGITAYTNPLHPDVFPGIRMMESEIVRMTCSLFGGGPDSCGTVTSGGTESIFLACKAYRDFAMKMKGISQPEIVLPVSAHAAFDKAGHLLQMKIKHVPLDPVTMKVNVKAMKKAITRNTCMLVCSTPTFPHGVVDPVQEVAKLGQRYNIPLHVDACLGGFLLPFMKQAGYPLPPCDFSVPGVTSISADTHKYGNAPKGSSVIMYSKKIYRHYQFSVQPDWPGGIYASPNLGGSRSGGVIAACWATLTYFGVEGYVESTRKIMNTAKYIEKGLRDIPGIYILGKPEVSVIAIGSKAFDIFRLIDALGKRGWYLNSLQFPSGFHFCVTLRHTDEGVADRFLSDVKECTAAILKDPKSPAKGTAVIYGMAQGIADRSIVSELAWAFLDACYSTENKIRNKDLPDLK